MPRTSPSTQHVSSSHMPPEHTIPSPSGTGISPSEQLETPLISYESHATTGRTGSTSKNGRTQEQCVARTTRITGDDIVNTLQGMAGREERWPTEPISREKPRQIHNAGQASTQATRQSPVVSTRTGDAHPHCTSGVHRTRYEHILPSS